MITLIHISSDLAGRELRIRAEQIAGISMYPSSIAVNTIAVTTMGGETMELDFCSMKSMEDSFALLKEEWSNWVASQQYSTT